MAPRIIKWDKEAFNQFQLSIKFIAARSIQNAEKVRNEILDKIATLIQYPENQSPDKFKLNNDGSFRALEIHHFRISFQVTDTDIKILRFRHTKQAPKNY